MTEKLQHSIIDRFLIQFDQALRTCVPGSIEPKRKSPATSVDEKELSTTEKQHAAGLMRINHTGEVCAQALYLGQATTARLGQIRKSMELAAEEEKGSPSLVRTATRRTRQSYKCIESSLVFAIVLHGSNGGDYWRQVESWICC